VVVIQTKCDKIHKSQWLPIRQKQAANLGVPLNRIVTTSASKKIGLEDLLSTMGNLLNDLHR
jgi:GTP-binding protein EngB required for normal cell division